MNRFFSFGVYLIISFLFILIQTSITTPNFLKLFTPDLNLILILYLATSKNIYGALYLAIINGLLMDIFSGNMLGLNSLLRLVVFTILLGSSRTFNIETLKSKISSIFLCTILFWILMFIVLKSRSFEAFNISINLILSQAIINTVVGTIFIILFRKLDARL